MPAAPKTSRSKPKGARERILEKAQELFYTQGFQNTGINQIIEESGTAKASFYQYFKSKDDLAISYLKYYEAHVVNSMQNLMKKYDTLEDFIHAWTKLVNRDVKYNKNFNGDPFANFAAQLQRDDHGPITDQIENVIKRMYDLFASHLKRAQQKGQISKKTDAGLLAQRLLAIYQGSLSMSKISNDLSYVQDLEKLIMQVIKSS